MNRIRELREEEGLKQSELGKILNVTKQAVSSYERGERQPDVDRICLLCDRFGCTVDYLIGRSDYRHSIMSKQQAKMLNAYDRAIPEIQDAVDRLLAPYMENASGKTGS